MKDEERRSYIWIEVSYRVRVGDRDVLRDVIHVPDAVTEGVNP